MRNGFTCRSSHDTESRIAGHQACAYLYLQETVVPVGTGASQEVFPCVSVPFALKLLKMTGQPLLSRFQPHMSFSFSGVRFPGRQALFCRVEV